LGLRVDVLSEPGTHASLLSEARDQRLTFDPALIPLTAGTDPEDLLATHAQPTDLVVVVSARPRSISHNAALDQLPRRLDKQYPEISLIMVYPATAPVAEDILELA
jgi:hypothetical protein